MKPVLLLTGCAGYQALVAFCLVLWEVVEVGRSAAFLFSGVACSCESPSPLLQGWVAPEFADVVLMVARDLAMVVERVRVPSSARSSWRCVVVRLLHILGLCIAPDCVFSLCASSLDPAAFLWQDYFRVMLMA